MKVEADVATHTFATLKLAVAKQFESMKHLTLYRADVSKDALWETYLSSFPEGMNPIYRERTEHDCQCCKHFIRAVGSIVAIIDGRVVSLWNCQAGEYQPVVDALAALVHSALVEGLFLHTEQVVGTEKSFEAVIGGRAKAWEHFHLRLPSAVVLKGELIGPKLSDARATHDVLLRSLTELSMDAIDTVLELIAQNSLYRGEEQKFAVTEFRKLKMAFDRLPLNDQAIKGVDLFVWDNVAKLNQSVSRIRNTAIGTLLVDLSEGKDMDAAVASFEAKVAPANYKRPTALVTKAMIAKAKKKGGKAKKEAVFAENMKRIAAKRKKHGRSSGRR